MSKRRSRKWIGVSFVVLAAFIFSVFALEAASAAPAKTIKWDFCPTTYMPGTYDEFYQTKEFTRRIMEVTDGAIDITTHIALVKARDIIDAVRDKRIHMGSQGTMYRADLALFNYVTLPGIPFEKLLEIQAKIRPILTKVALDKFDVVLLGYGYWPRQQLLTIRPAATFKELKGIKFRTHSVELLQLLKAIGGSPVSVASVEVYTALQRRTLDGGVTSLTYMRSGKWIEVATHVNYWQLGNAAYMFIVNKDAWNKVPADLQQKILKESVKLEAEMFAAAAKADEDDKVLLKKLGVTYHYPPQKELDKLMAGMDPVIKNWKKRAGPHADEVLAIINEMAGTNF